MFRYITVISLILLMLVSTTGYNIAAHLCHGKAVSYALFGEPEGCFPGEKMTPEEHCDHRGVATPVEQPCLHTQQCCTNEHQYIQGLEQCAPAAKQFFHIGVVIGPPVAGIPAFPPRIFASAIKPVLGDYHPPKRRRDLPVLLHVFRI